MGIGDHRSSCCRTPANTADSDRSPTFIGNSTTTDGHTVVSCRNDSTSNSCNCRNNWNYHISISSSCSICGIRTYIIFLAGIQSAQDTGKYPCARTFGGVRIGNVRNGLCSTPAHPTGSHCSPAFIGNSTSTTANTRLCS